MDSASTPGTDGTSTEPSSLVDRLTNVLAAPTEAFAGIANAPARVTHWLVPLILACLAAAIYVCIAVSQPAVVRDTKEKQDIAMKKRVAQGKMTQAEADQATAVAEKFFTPTVAKLLGAAIGVLTSVVGLFLMTVAIWLVLKAVTGNWLHYMKVVEVCGLALMIDVVQKIVRSFLVLWKENLLATVSPTLFLANPDTGNHAHLFLSLFDLVDFWWLAVLSVGVSKVAGIRYRTAAFVTFGIWFGFRITAILLTPPA